MYPLFTDTNSRVGVYHDQSSSAGSDDQVDDETHSPPTNPDYQGPDTYDEDDYPASLPSYHSDSENEEVERFKEEVECEVANFLLERADENGTTVEVKIEPCELPQNQPNLDLPPPSPFLPLYAKRKPRKALRRPKPETIRTLSGQSLTPSHSRADSVPFDYAVAPPERTHSNVHRHAPDRTHPHINPTLDPSWGNHNLASADNSWESVYDQYYVHPSPVNEPRLYRIPKARNSVETSTEDSSVFSDNQARAVDRGQPCYRQPPLLPSREVPYPTSQPLYRPLTTSECNERWLLSSHNGQCMIPNPSDFPSQPIQRTPRLPLSDQSNVHLGNPRRKRRLHFQNNRWFGLENAENFAPPLAPPNYCSESRTPPTIVTRPILCHPSPELVLEEKINSVGNLVEELRRDFHDLKHLAPANRRNLPGAYPGINDWRVPLSYCGLLGTILLYLVLATSIGLVT